MADQPSHYHRGHMDIREQAATFEAFNAMTKWGSLFLAAMLTLLVLWFCVGTGFLGAFAAFVVEMALGILLLRRGSPDAH